MKKLLASCLALAMALGLTGCGGSDSAEKKDSVIVAVGGDTADLDPAIVDDSITNNILVECYDGLYKLDKDGNIVTNLATDMPEVSEDGLTYTIKVKKDVKWSNGDDLKASDFVYAWKRAVSLGSGKAYYSTFISNYVAGATDGASMDELNNTFGAKAVDDNTIEITLKQKCAYFTKLMAQSVFYPVNEAYVSAHDPMSTNWGHNEDSPYLGAFKVTKVNTKDEVKMVKNDKYYAANEVKLKSITFKVMKDMDAQTNGFKSGEIDFATSVNNDTVEADDSLKDLVYMIDPFVCNYFVLVNAGDENTNPILKDVDIRNAIGLAINRKDILEVLNFGENASQIYGLIPKGIPGTDNKDFRTQQDKQEKLADYNLKEAQKIMKAKGYNEKNMLKLSYSYNDNTMHKTVAESMQASLKKAYIDLELKATEKEAFFDARDKGDFEICRHAMTADYMDPMAYLSMYYNNGGKLAGNTADDQTYEDMITAAEKLDGDERMAKLHEAENYLVGTQHYVIPLFQYSEKILKVENLEGVTSSPDGHYNLTRAEFK